jgi:RNA polymerase sigma-70 factor, ECF subfamily
LERIDSSPVIVLNRAVAVAMAEGPNAALAIIDGLVAEGNLEKYHLLHAARADMLRRIGSREQAAHSYARAIELVQNARERTYLERRLREVNGANG